MTRGWHSRQWKGGVRNIRYSVPGCEQAAHLQIALYPALTPYGLKDGCDWEGQNRLTLELRHDIPCRVLCYEYSVHTEYGVPGCEYTQRITSEHENRLNPPRTSNPVLGWTCWINQGIPSQLI